MTIQTIKPAGGGDWTTLTGWVGSLSATLSAPQQADIYKNGSTGLVESSGVPISGFTTTSTNKLILNVPVGERHNGGVAYSGAFVTGVTGSGAVTTIRLGTDVDYFDVNWLEVECLQTNAAAWHWATHCTSGSTRWFMEHCIIHSPSNAPIGVCDTAGSAQIYRNTLFYVGNGSRILDARGAASVEVSNCVFWTNGGDFVTLLDSNATVKNSYAGGSSNTDWGFAGSPTGSFNAAHDTSATATFSNSINSIAGATAFTSVTSGSEDFRTKSGFTGFTNLGTTVAAVTDDIIGTARPQGAAYDIGIFENIVSSSFVAAQQQAIIQAVKRASYY